MKSIDFKFFFVLLILASFQSLAWDAADGIKTELILAKTNLKADEPIIVDVYVQNITNQDLQRPRMSPGSQSGVGMPSFEFTRVLDGKTGGTNPGLLDDDWNSWYLATNQTTLFDFTLPKGQRIHLLHGDIRKMMVLARQHCQRELNNPLMWQDQFNLSTKRNYEELVKFSDDFLNGGTYDVRAYAYAPSSKVRITIEPPPNVSVVATNSAAKLR